MAIQQGSIRRVHGLQWAYGMAQLRAVTGCRNGLKVPSACLLLATEEVRPDVIEKSGKGLYALGKFLGLSDASAPTSAVADTQIIGAQVQVWINLMSAALGQLDATLSTQVAGLPLLVEREALFTKNGESLSGILVFWPTYWSDAIVQVLAWSLARWRDFSVMASKEQDEKCFAEAEATWQKLQTVVKAQLPSGLNSAHLLNAACKLNRPVQWLERNIIQLGYGRHARLMHSTMTDATPSLGVVLARDKFRAARLLRQIGLPVPQHIEVADAEAAVAAAARLGWPVVVKPADLDRGDGARANLMTSEQVRTAFAHANTLSERILVEQHVSGQEYRLTVVNGALFWAHERVPASVTGDGQNSLRALIDAENQLRRQALLTAPYGLVPIHMDANNIGYLQENGRNLEDVPAVNEVVRLQLVPAATTGGDGRAYFDSIHPDNRRLAERAAQLLRLDIAGVDMITPDITRSWREVGGAITEINAVPQISIQTDPTLVQRLLQKIMPHSGRIPLLFVLTEEAKPVWLDDVLNELEASGLRVGLTTAEGLQVSKDWIRGLRTSVWEDIRLLQKDPSVGAIVIISDGDNLLQTGLPFDALDALVVQANRPQVLSLLMPYVRGVKLDVGQDWKICSNDHEAALDLTQAIVSALLQAESEYGKPAHV